MLLQTSRLLLLFVILPPPPPPPGLAGMLEYDGVYLEEQQQWEEVSLERRD